MQPAHAQVGVATTMGLDLSLAAPGLVILGNGADILMAETLVWQPDKTEMVRTKSGKSKTLSAQQKIERLIDIRDHIVTRASEYAVQSVAIEGYAFSRHSSSVTGLAELGGVVRAGLLESLGIVPLTLPVSQCRHFVIGRGNVKKDDAQRWLQEKGLVFDSDDEGDAYIVALTGFYLTHPEYRTALDAERQAIIDAITTGKRHRRKRA